MRTLPSSFSRLGLLGVLALAACGDSTSSLIDTSDTAPDSRDTSDTAPDSADMADATDTRAPSDTADAISTADAADAIDTAEVPVERGPKAIAIDGDPNGLWWDAAGQTLYVADDDGNRILRWTDAAGFALVANLPTASPDGAGLGQLVKLADGRLVVTRFGYGTTGSVVVVDSDGNSRELAGLDATRRRIGLALAPDGTLYTSWFTKSGQNPRVGGVGRLTLEATATETLLVEGLKKPVGVLATDTELIISDQDLGQIVIASRNDPSTLSVRATVSGLDLIAAGPDGSVFVGGTDGAVRRVTVSGEVTSIAAGFLQVRGVAWDSVHRRIFIAEHDSVGSAHALYILPLD